MDSKRRLSFIPNGTSRPLKRSLTTTSFPSRRRRSPVCVGRQTVEGHLIRIKCHICIHMIDQEILIRVSFRILVKEVKIRYNGLLGSENYPPRSKAYGHLEHLKYAPLCKANALGSGGMLPRKILKHKCSEIESEAF